MFFYGCEFLGLFGRWVIVFILGGGFDGEDELILFAGFSIGWFHFIEYNEYKLYKIFSLSDEDLNCLLDFALA